MGPNWRGYEQTTTKQAFGAPPLAQLRKILGWTRVDCSEASGLTPSNVQNIERGAAPLSPETAFALEGATGCNAMQLAESSELWRRLSGMQPEVMEQTIGATGATNYADKFHPVTLQFEPYTREYYQHYLKHPLPPEHAQNAVLDLGRRMGLLLGTLASEPGAFAAPTDNSRTSSIVSGRRPRSRIRRWLNSPRTWGPRSRKK